MSKKTKKSATPRAARKASTKTPVTTSPGTSSPSPFVGDPRLPPPGAVLQRAYKGKVHEVTVREGGFEHEGTAYRSLSALARQITGFASINGFLFFGLTKPEKSAPAPRTPKGTPEQVASVAKARTARAAKVAARKAAQASS